MSSPTADRLVCTASHAVWSSKSRVNHEFGRAQGTDATTTPCTEQRTLGARDSMNTFIVPRSMPRHRRCPAPWS